ncbi:hypothetical protein PRUPE_5G155100 [Prunus persica]|uniref:ABC1 atypical kinase-like domain-containing protein n=1 Tax=Prunus persica TaxID=3760 RepID=A0A251PCF2_PRUPE|nr:hypothetical protein PRUPE_5G155100 [Prunus persica]
MRPRTVRNAWKIFRSFLLILQLMYMHQGLLESKPIRRLGIQLDEVARLVSETFAEMMFKHGFVHCDPHAANLLVRPLPYSLIAARAF